MEVRRVETIWYTSGVIYVYRFLPKRRVSHLSINADDAWKYRYSVYDYEQSPSVAKLELEKRLAKQADRQNRTSKSYGERGNIRLRRFLV